jgi:hypothetical protein
MGIKQMSLTYHRDIIMPSSPWRPEHKLVREVLRKIRRQIPSSFTSSSSAATSARNCLCQFTVCLPGGFPSRSQRSQRVLITFIPRRRKYERLLYWRGVLSVLVVWLRWRNAFQVNDTIATGFVEQPAFCSCFHFLFLLSEVRLHSPLLL